MYSFFDLASSAGSKTASFASAVILSAILMATAIVPASPASPIFAGAMA